MTPVTLVAVAPSMGVVGAVATYTLFRHPYLNLNGRIVTGFARQIIMLASQWIFGLFVMVKNPKTPSVGVMAGGAPVGKAAVVPVVGAVAIGASGFNLFVGRVQVTRLARHRRV